MDLDTRVGCYAWIERDDRVLLTHWVSMGVDAGRRISQGWTLPGGGLEAGEDTEQAAIREVAEETGYVVRLGALLTLDSVHVSAEERVDGGPRPLHVLRVIYLAEVVGGEFAVEQDGSTDDAGWFTRAEIEEMDCVSLVDVARAEAGWA